MTVRLLAAVPLFGTPYTIPAGAVVQLDGDTEAGLIAAKLAVSTADAPNWSPPDPAPYPQSAVWVVDAKGRPHLMAPGGDVAALATAAQAGTALTATGTSYTGAHEFWGIEVTAYNGGPQTIVVRDGTDGSSAAIATFVVSGVGFYPYSGNWTTPGGGQNLSRAFATGAHLTISGGTSRTVAAVVTPV